MESTKSFTEVSVHSSENDDDEIIFEEEVIEEEEVDEGEGVETLNDTGNASGPVKSNAPLPLHQLLANKLKNTNVKLTEPGESKPKSVRELAAAFQSPRPASAGRPKPVDTGRLKAASVWPTTEQFNKSPEQQSQKKARTQPTKSQKSPGKSKPIFKLKPVNIRKVSTRPPSVRGRRIPPRPITATESKVDRMEVLNEGNKDDSSGSSSSLPTPDSSTRDSSSGKNSSQNESQTKTRKYDGSVSGTSSSSSKSSESGSDSGSESSSDSGSGFSISVSSGTDESLAAKLGDLGTPFEPMPIASNFIPDTSNRDESGSSSSNTPEGTRSMSQKSEEGPTMTGTFALERDVSWSDLLGDGNKKSMSASVGHSPKGGDDSDSDSYESYETASSEEEFETDTSEREQSKKLGEPQPISPEDLLDDQESAATSDYETDTTYERQFAEAEGRTPPPPKRSNIPYLSPLERPSYTPMPVLNENETKEEWPNETGPQLKSNSYYEKRRGRRKPFEDVPTAVAAELRNVSKNDPATSSGGSTLLGLTGWDGQRRGGRGNCFDQFLKKKKGDGENILNDPNNLSPIPLPLPPRPFDPPDYDDDEVSNITDRVFSPKQPSPEQPRDHMQEDLESRRTREFSDRFSITSFRQSNSVRNTERALEGLKTTSIDPTSKDSRDIPALLNMQNETVDFYYPRERQSGLHSVGDNEGFSPSSSRAFDSRDIETQIKESQFHDVYDPNRTEIVEEVFVGYDDDDRASHSRFEYNEEVEGGNERSKPTKSKRMRWITCIVIFNLLLLLAIATWLLLEYFLLGERNGSSIGPGKTPSEIRAQLKTILSPALPDGGKSLEQEGSPQSGALDWLSNDPLVYTYDNEKISIRFALATFYYATGGDSWTTNHLWLSDLDECLWFTSSADSPCTKEGRYSRLVLADNNLEGVLPDELSLLSHSLVSLDLDGTFTGEIPLNIGDLTKLTTLRLSGRALSGEIPNSLYTLSNLSSLDLGQNLLSGKFSGAIAIMSSSLTSLSLTSNQFTGSIPREIGQLTELKNLNMDDNYFNFVSQADLGRLTKLEMLSIRNNALKGSLPSTIGNSLRNLRGLFLNNNEFTGTIPDSYGNLSRLETGLDLSSNRLTGRVPESLGQLSMLKNLLIRDNGLSGTIPLSWGKLSILNTLRLDSTNIEGEMPTEVCNNFNEAFSSFYVDCWKLDCPCCNFCCDGNTGECVCRFADSIPILCIEP